MEHTKGKLEVKGIADKRGQCDRYVLGTNKMALVMKIVSNTQANAHRLVLCWNEHDKLIQQRDDLLEALEGLIKDLEATKIRDGLSFGQIITKAETWEKAEQAISKAKPNEETK